MKRFSLKALAVVTLMTSIGWFAGSVKSRQVAQPPAGTVVRSDTSGMLGGTNTVTQTVVNGGRAAAADDTFHSFLLLDDHNLGGPGELAIRGVYQIGVPNPVEVGDRANTIMVSVRDIYGDTIVDRDPIGTLVDRVGVGHWSREFRWSKPFLPGKYYVEMAAILPGTSVTQPDGTVGPHSTGYSSIYAIVK